MDYVKVSQAKCYLCYHLSQRYNDLQWKCVIHLISFLFPDKGSRLMNYSRSTEDYRQLSVDYSDTNSISESTSLILSNRGHRRGKIFLKDYCY